MTASFHSHLPSSGRRERGREPPEGEARVTLMQCPRCKRSNPDDAAFCEECGAKLERICPKCSAPIVPTAKFCKKCGAPLSAVDLAPKEQLGAETRAPTEASDGERKTITALFADIKGSMELMEDLDPEEARSIIDPALHLMMDSVHHYGGHVAQSTGDGIFALFGAPQAYEDHPQRALYAALKMQAEMRQYDERLRLEKGVDLKVRVGINTGEVVVRSLRKDAAHTDYL